MPSGFMGDMPPQDKIEILNAQISELEQRKNNLQAEVSKFYQEYKNKLNTDYNTRLRAWEKDSVVVKNSLDKREENIHKKETALDSKEKTIEAECNGKLKEVNAKDGEIEALKKSLQETEAKLKIDYDEKARLLAIDKNKLQLENDRIVQKEQVSINIQKSVSDKERALDEREKSISVREKDIEERIAFQSYLENENDRRNKELKEGETNLILDKQDLEKISEDTAKLNKEANLKLTDANKLLAETNIRLANLEAKEKELVNRGNALGDFRDTLDERELTLNEKDRYITLRARILDDKIKILNDLRAADKK